MFYSVLKAFPNLKGKPFFKEYSVIHSLRHGNMEGAGSFHVIGDGGPLELFSLSSDVGAHEVSLSESAVESISNHVTSVASVDVAAVCVSELTEVTSESPSGSNSSLSSELSSVHFQPGGKVNRSGALRFNLRGHLPPIVSSSIMFGRSILLSICVCEIHT